MDGIPQRRACLHHRLAQRRAVGIGHVDVNDAVLPAVEEGRVSRFREIEKLVWQDKIIRLVVKIQ